MEHNHETHLIEIPLGGKQGLLWNRLHEEREEITEALLKKSEAAHQRRSVLETRLKTLDRALDRLMSGSFGLCSRCGEPIEESTLDVDPAWTECLNCWSKGAYRSSEGREAGAAIDLESLDAWDTIILRTLNSEYRILLLDPKAGRALVEGGSHLPQPGESLLMGSTTSGSDVLRRGVICVGGRLRMWVDDQVLSTSLIQSFQVKHNPLLESVQSISLTVH